MPSVALASPTSSSRAPLSAMTSAWRSASLMVPLPASTTRLSISCMFLTTDCSVLVWAPSACSACLRLAS
ncbi:Uncharacterised protein [Bordetella pertussis]|nr:Uncharacterised protein [Bordetella pertussis]